jgi:serine/threonine-protein kinase
MGLVYLAHDPKIDRKVAIKTIHRPEGAPEADGEEFRQRFLREAQAAGKLIHPGIVTIFDVGEEQGLSYIAMEYIEGQTLDNFAKPTALLPVEKTVRFIIQACRALDHAHKHSVVHRDVKPANLMMVSEKQIKVTDFGLAKNPQANLTSAGTLVGTPNYMSPEQVMGRPLDGRSDLFSLGIVLYELLTGERPFGGETISTIIYRVLHELPKRPEIANTRVPQGLADIILKALEKDPANRYQTGEEFAEALEVYLDAATRRVPAVARPSRADTSPSIALARPSTPAEPPQRPSPPPAASLDRSPKSPPTLDRPLKSTPTRPAPMPLPSPRARRSFVGPLLIVVALAGIAAAGVLFVPQVREAVGLPTAGWARGGPSKASAGGIDSAAGSPAPAPVPATPPVDLPGGLPAGEVVSLAVATDPPGGKIYMDDHEITGGTIVLGKSDTAPHTLVGENECFVDRMPLAAGAREGVVIKLKTPKVNKVQVTTEPSSAKLLVDGKELRAQASGEIDLAACEPHTLAASLPGYQDVSRKFAADTVWSKVSPIHLALEKLPEGSLVVKGAPYDLQIFEGGKRIGNSGGPITLSAGKHALTLTNEDLFVDVKAEVHVTPGKDVTPKIAYPGIGQLTVYALPGNGDVFINGRKLGPPPIVGQSIAEGTYTLRYALDSGESDERTVLIIAGQSRQEKIKINR